jgi:putative oxygen-independent coproporphyrinogen III oxidase
MISEKLAGTIATGPALEPADPGFGIYVHWPFCLAKCPYCDFNSHVRHRQVDQMKYAQALVRELEHQAQLAKGKKVNSIFFGGGTPSLMQPQVIESVLAAISSLWELSKDVEISMEANPTSVEAGNFAAYRKAGVNRLSLGIQSLRDGDLKKLGRLHTAEEALEALNIAQEHFERVSFDLIYAREGQSLKDWRNELRQALKLAPEHLSLYQLTIEPDTRFEQLYMKGVLEIPDPDLARAFYDVTMELTARAGLPAYEISNHARPGAECRHNLIYWRYGDYAGVGPGAHARLSVQGKRLALVTEKHPETWLARVEKDGHACTDMEWLESEEQGDEMLLMGLRLREGIDPRRYAQIAGRPLNPRRINMLEEQNFLERLTNGRIRATHEGWMLLDALVADLAV